MIFGKYILAVIALMVVMWMLGELLRQRKR